MQTIAHTVANRLLLGFVIGISSWRIHPLVHGAVLGFLAAVTVANEVGADVVLVDREIQVTLKRTWANVPFTKKLMLKRGAKSVSSCVLLDKNTNRAVEFEADHAGFRIDDLFVVGYGLDYDNRYRELPHIAKVNFA